MNNFFRTLPLILLFVGEAVYIWAEMIIANSAKSPVAKSLPTIIKMGLVCIISGFVITAGYYFGYKHSRNIWLVTATSISAILITEPLVSWLVFHEIPTKGASLGLFFGFLGIISTIIF